MAQDLVIVESPAKARTIKKFLGNKYKVEASMGHVRDLPKSQLGVDIENDFEPKYITIRGKGDIINRLKKEAQNAERVYLATDPDREGEAISWHLAHLLDIDPNSTCRIEFHEITQQAIRNAIKHPRAINMCLVDAQQARRVLDRVVGYMISPLLWRKIKGGLSAGRVQSVATRMICEREREIQEFVPEEYWIITGRFVKEDGRTFEADFYGTVDNKVTPKSEEEVKGLVEKLRTAKYAVHGVKRGVKKRSAPPPFTTSTLQQEAYRKLGFTTQKTMMIAQQLYEGVEIRGEGAVGLVTYIRTDSTRIAEQAQKEALEYIRKKYGQQYVPEKPNQYKSKKGAQDAHEAIRPTSVLREPEAIKDSLTYDQYRLYRLIYDRFLASQMAPALYDTMTIEIVGDNGYLFRATGSRKTFAGYTIIYMEGSDNEKPEKENEDVELPEVSEGEKLSLEEVLPEQHFTQPPPRYTEASLVRALEEMGIGRPSTYAPTISTIIERGYVVREKKSLVPTELGFIVNDLMMTYFPDIVDYKFTAEMEKQLDEVEEGKKDWREIVREFYIPFKELLKKADEAISKIEIKEEVSDVKCEKCGANMVIKAGRYGKFLACPNFPKCRNTKPYVEEIAARCPKCNSAIVVKYTKKGKKFYGCENYPECDFISWDMPADQRCPECGALMVVKQRKNGEEYLLCTNKECGYRQERSEVNYE
ncbi:DNA topoisomerase-1 [Caldicoprobacter guelmensis]|uniref:type I DNA topoisomerase n=1 Tax=Caldicoprobacter guelmensis TaxID=1170224 RepID=UPI00195B1A22|nr:DNA topoisomerase-1 [Caldicoprobacter guelmensis]